MQRAGLGLDLGTTTSLASIVDSRGRPEVVSGPVGRHLIPSAIYFDANIVVGESALELGLRDPEGLAEAFKRDIGKPHYSREIRSTQVPPEVLTGFLIRHLLANVRSHCGDVNSAVVTVPAYFDERKRTATQQAAQLAGLEVLDIINEPTAAAIALGHEMMIDSKPNEKPRRLLVYDLGGGTFDVTLLEFADRTFRALGTDGDIYLGGRDFDERIIAIISDQFRDRHGIDPRQNIVEMQKLWKHARELKHVLSTQASVPVDFECDGMRVQFELAREDFEDAIEPLVERSMATTRDVILAAGSSWDEIDEFLLVGGSSRIPLIAAKAQELSGLLPRLASNPDELIAHGAALYAATKRGDILDAAARFDVVNVNAHSLGVRGTDAATKHKVNKILIPRNTPLPASRIYSFVTSRDGQRNAKVPLLEGESENPDFCTLLGECLVKIDVPLPKGTGIKVICNYAANGTISVTAKLAHNNTAAYVEIRRDGYSTLESLDVWTARLTSGGDIQSTDVLTQLAGRPAALPLADRTDKDKVIARLDELYRFVGKLSVNATPPASAVQTHRLVGSMQQETTTLKQLIRQLEMRHQQTERFQDRLELAGQLAQLKMAWEHSMRLLDHSLVVLGRECIVGNLVDTKADGFLDEARELQTVLDG
ncbi:MAG: Hsp70 family protein [Pirellulaceae bacterium]|nr:Hsp70 family protein [Pirellulaceae bacterium]